MQGICRRWCAIILSLCLLLPLAACAAKEPYALTIDGNQVGAEVYQYYLAAAEQSAGTDKNAEETAAQLCSRYVAGNTLLTQYGVSLTAEQKVAVAAQLKGAWQYSAAYYRQHGISKQTLCAMLEYEKLLENLTIIMFEHANYAKNAAQSYFYQNYAAANMIHAAFTNAAGKALNQSEQASLTEIFTDMRNMVRRGGTLASAAAQYPDIAEYDDTAVSIIAKDDDAYPAGMFENVMKMEPDAVQVFRFPDGIYLIRRVDMKADTQYFERYRNECILKIYRDTAENEINTLAQSYKIEYNK